MDRQGMDQEKRLEKSANFGGANICWFFQPFLLCLFLGRELLEHPIEVLLGTDCQVFVFACLKADRAIFFIVLSHNKKVLGRG